MTGSFSLTYDQRGGNDIDGNPAQMKKFVAAAMIGYGAFGALLGRDVLGRTWRGRPNANVNDVNMACFAYGGDSPTPFDVS